jgi:hypothetical protein
MLAEVLFHNKNIEALNFKSTATFDAHYQNTSALYMQIKSILRPLADTGRKVMINGIPLNAFLGFEEWMKIVDHAKRSRFYLF